MATGPRYRVPLRRRREGKTNYYQRRELLKSGMLRVVIRRSTKHMRVQFVEARADGDLTLSDCSSYSLPEFGWKLSGGNIPAAYLTGYLAGKQALSKGIKEGILDLGLQSNTKGSRIYATLKGVIDAGVSIPASEDIFPEDNVISGSHIEIAGNSVKEESADLLKQQFARYTKNKVKIDGIPKLVNTVKKNIDGKF